MNCDSPLPISEDRMSGLARYDILHEVARGGMGIVYRARHKTLGMDVAIKVLQPGRSADRFTREARLLAKIQCPYVVRVTDFDLLPDGKPMLVMEWVEGLDLYQTMQTTGGRIPESQALPWMQQVCEGMIAAASEGVVHRDLKPSNVMIDRQGRAKVTDFGLARLSGGEQVIITTDGSHTLGTPLYMAPEQAEDPRSADTRSDIYSFGAMFYHLLTGAPPFDGESYFAVLLKHKLDPLISPKARCPELSEAMSQLLERCLAKTPGERFQTFAEIRKHLNREVSELAWAVHHDEGVSPILEKLELRFRDCVAGRISDSIEFPGEGRLRIVYGNIVDQEADAIVSSDNSRLTMSYGVSRAIALAAGKEVHTEAQRYIPVRPGRAVVTSAGRLKTRFIFHGVSIGWDPPYEQPSRDLIVEIIKSCLYHADTLGVRTLAFPLLGTGAAGFPIDVCLDTMFRYLARTLQRGLTSVRGVSLVIFCRPVLSGLPEPQSNAL